MAFRLRDNLHWCNCSGRPVFLDAEADRYFCLPATAGEAFLRLASGQSQANDPEHLRALITRGLLIDDPDSTGLNPARPIEAVNEDFPRGARASIGDVAGALAADLKAAWLLRTKPFLILVNTLEWHPPRRPSSAGDETLCRILAASQAVSLLLGATNRCLVRALAVHSTCRRKGIQSKLVLGVRMNPFGAHSWVQLGGSVLVGDFEQVRLYTPILALG